MMMKICTQKGIKMKSYPQFLANFLLNDYTGLLKKHNFKLEQGFPHNVFGILVERCYKGYFTRTALKRFINESFTSRSNA